MGKLTRLGSFLLLAGALSLGACSDDDDDGGSGGSAGSGKGGSSGSGTGGSSGSGTGGSAGAATGGSAGAATGGSAGAATGGSAGASGSAGAAGAAGSAGAAGGDAGPPVAEAVSCAGVAPDATVTIQGTVTLQSFNPGNVTVNVNDVVRWVNDTQTGHTVTSGVTTNSNQWSELVIATKAQNGEGCIKFLAAGTYQYHCSIHPTLLGSVTVQ